MTSPQSVPVNDEHLQPQRNEQTEAQKASWRGYLNGFIAEEISLVTRYYDKLIQIMPRPEDTGILFRRIESPSKKIVAEISELPSLKSEKDLRTVILLNGNLNHDFDIQNTLISLKEKLARTSRVALVSYNPYFRWFYALANRFGIRQGEMPQTFVTKTDLSNLAALSGFEVVRIRQIAFIPWRAYGIGTFLNRVLPAIPLLRWLGLVSLIFLRPVIEETGKPSLSIVIPARNEKGNIENALKRMPEFGGADKEIIFIEGHSNDGTWEEIERVQKEYSEKFSLSSYRQTGKGKSDAVRLGFSKASKDLLVILDADLTMPPELLERFYEAYRQGLGDFINGNRLVYPMEGQAMMFLNHLGNIFFAKALSFVLGNKLGDSLCGTKMLGRHDYDRFIAWRNDFGDVDPFGDFELLFPASILALGIMDLPMRYRDRTYGSTNIRRFYHGWMLLKMTWIGLLHIKLGAMPKNSL